MGTLVSPVLFVGRMGMSGVIVLPDDVFWVVVQAAVEHALMLVRGVLAERGVTLDESVFRKARDGALDWVKVHLPLREKKDAMLRALRRLQRRKKPDQMP